MCVLVFISEEKIRGLRRRHLKEIREELAERSVRQELSKLRNTSNLSMTHANAIQHRMLQLEHGELTLTSFRKLLCELFPGDTELSTETAELFFDAFDTDKSGTIDVPELIRGAGLCSSKDVSSFVTNMFNVFDVDRSGERTSFSLDAPLSN